MGERLETLAGLLCCPLVVIPMIVAAFMLVSYLTKKFKKYVKFYISIDSERVMEDGVPYKVFMYLDNDAKPEVRRFNVDKVVCGKIKPLKAKLVEIYPTLKAKNFTLAWKDEDGDEILMSSDEEVKTMLSECHDPVLKLIVRRTDEKSTNNEDADVAPPTTGTNANAKNLDGLHQGVTCDVCGNFVVGYRYKCITCDNFDLCVRCENDGKHPEHCVVRVPIPNMPMPLLKASIKKSRRFLKSVASQAHEENKKLRRERGHAKPTSDATNKGKDSQPVAPRSWIDVFGKCMEQFTNLAGDTPVNPKAGTSAGTEFKKATTCEDILQNPWGLHRDDHDKLLHAFGYVRENALPATLNPLAKVYNKVLDIAATLTEEVVSEAQNPQAQNSQARATSPIREISARKNSQATSVPNQEVSKPEQPKPKQETPKPKQETPKPKEVSAEPEPVAPKVVQQEKNHAQEASTSGVGPSTSESDKIVAQTDDIIKFTLGKQAASQNVADATVANIYFNRSDIPELVNAVFAAKSELSSNASSCSSEGQGSEKADGWTVIDDCESAMKDDKTENYPDNMRDLPEEIQERIRCHAPIYPALNTATAVLNPQDANAASAAPAPAQPQIDPKQASRMALANAKVAIASAKVAQAAQAAHDESVALATKQRQQLPAHIEAALELMETMGFSNEAGWLTQLLIHNDGNIAAVLDLITPNGSSRKIQE